MTFLFGEKKILLVEQIFKREQKLKNAFCEIKHSKKNFIGAKGLRRTDRWTKGPTDRQTNELTFRAAQGNLKGFHIGHLQKQIIYQIPGHLKLLCNFILKL